MEDQHKYVCDRCHYNTDRLPNLKRHLQREKVCEVLFQDVSRQDLLEKYKATKAYDCPTCKKGFSTAQSRWRHKKTCKAGETTHDLVKMIKDLQEEVRELRLTVPTPTTTTNHSNTHTNCNNTINNNHQTIIINAYDKPNLEYLTPNFLTQCVKRRDKGLCELLQHIHYHPEHTENHNVRISNKKLSLIETHDGERFQYQQKDKVLDELVREGFEILENHYLENEEEVQRALNYNESRLEEVREFLEACRDQDIHVLTPLKQNVYLLILNKQYIIFKKKQPLQSDCSSLD
jgi:hypothetical protein